MRRFHRTIHAGAAGLAVALGAGLSTPAPGAWAASAPFPVTADDGFVLDGVIERPDDRDPAAPERVIILLHGSGPQSMDADLTAVTRGGQEGQQNMVFRDLSAGLVRGGFTVVRYNKRSHQIVVAARADPAFVQGPVHAATTSNPLKWFVNQTPAYNAKAVELVARHVWRKGNFRFTYFPGLGHALDVREGYDDLQYAPIAPDALATLVVELAAFF